MLCTILIPTLSSVGYTMQVNIGLTFCGAISRENHALTHNGMLFDSGTHLHTHARIHMHMMQSDHLTIVYVSVTQRSALNGATWRKRLRDQYNYIRAGLT